VKAAGGIYAGLMSGTSLDGVDAVLAQWPERSPEPSPELLAGTSPEQLPAQASGLPRSRPRELAFVHLDFDAKLRQELLALNQTGANELHRAALAANALAEVYGQTVQELVRAAGLQPQDVRAVGAHGQTVRHQPHLLDHAAQANSLGLAQGATPSTGYTIQLLNGALLAERCSIDVVCDFRSRDVAAGGHGAPLVPAFHAACFAQPGRDVAVLNLGGIANWTVLPAAGALGVRGFDSGPGNMLLDAWCQRHRGVAFDAGGQWAAGGTVDTELLAHCLREPFFALAPPKSTGRDLFNADWLDARLRALPRYSLFTLDSDAPLQANVAATLTELTAQSVAQALLQHGPATSQVLVCGGGGYNDFLMARLRHNLPTRMAVQSTAVVGIAPEKVEALAFAWLAMAFVQGRPGNLPAVTGAQGLRLLGALHRA
jgi:anhydro-N-acetylmuramic acid kinase